MLCTSNRRSTRSSKSLILKRHFRPLYEKPTISGTIARTLARFGHDLVISQAGARAHGF